MSSLLSMTGSLCGPDTTVCSNGTFSTTLNTNTDKKVAATGLYAVTKVNDSWAWLTRNNDKGSRSMHYCARCGRIKDMSALFTGNGGFKETSVYLSTCLPVDLSTYLLVYLSTCLHIDLSTRPPVYPSTCWPVDLSTCLRFRSFKAFKFKTKESERALLCKMWQGKGDLSALSTGNRGFRRHLSTCLLVYLSTCRPVYMSTCRTVYLSTCQSVYMSICRHVYLSTYRPVYPSTCIPVDLSTVPYF